ncbi:MAG: RHS repeat protein, partial [Gammaproteobacteria bacterium]|nr:RHS repeat protein [Gammaproteobacteria bacterium]NIU03234.1 RHS repeat protein [Gammaproteobacteria bacterium]NIV50723.1 hypothetical protein [Gammaproteobacteria bacterium]NIX84509.1 hypothetical protein [Gammaproteobacteria bacterium]
DTSSIAYALDSLKRITRIAGPSEFAARPQFDMAYDALGRRARLTDAGGKAVDYTYDDVSNLLRLSGDGFPGDIGDIRYAYDPT